MEVKLIQQLQKELICSTCSHYYRKPVSIDCGHSLCQQCFIGKRNPEAGTVFCPECKDFIIVQWMPGVNARFGGIVDLGKELKRQFLQYSEGQPQCPIHQKFLKLFCEDDQTALCVICSEAQEHQAHKLYPIEEGTPNKLSYNLGQGSMQTR